MGHAPLMQRITAISIKASALETTKDYGAHSATVSIASLRVVILVRDLAVLWWERSADH